MSVYLWIRIGRGRVNEIQIHLAKSNKRLPSAWTWLFLSWHFTLEQSWYESYGSIRKFLHYSQFVRQRAARLSSLKSAILVGSHTEFHLLKPGFANSEARNAPWKLSSCREFRIKFATKSLKRFSESNECNILERHMHIFSEITRWTVNCLNLSVLLLGRNMNI